MQSETSELPELEEKSERTLERIAFVAFRTKSSLMMLCWLKRPKVTFGCVPVI
jgi:hypothetical protein